MCSLVWTRSADLCIVTVSLSRLPTHSGHLKVYLEDLTLTGNNVMSSLIKILDAQLFVCCLLSLLDLHRFLQVDVRWPVSWEYFIYTLARKHFYYVFPSLCVCVCLCDQSVISEKSHMWLHPVFSHLFAGQGWLWLFCQNWRGADLLPWEPKLWFPRRRSCRGMECRELLGAPDRHDPARNTHP